MKHILLPTDFSENSFNAIEYATALLENEECNFYLLNTYTPVLYDAEYILYTPTPHSLDEVYKKNSENGLKRIEQRLLKKTINKNHVFHKISSFNLLNDEIKDQVEKNNIDLIIMGTKGATGANEILFGSHTVHTFKNAKCPVLAIPSHFQFKSPGNILFPTDYGINFNETSINLLLDIANSHTANIHVLNVFLGVPLDPNQENNKRVLNEILKAYKHTFYSKQEKNIPKAIFEFQENNNIDLIVMLNNKRSFFSNLLFKPVINEIGFHVKVPFLVIPTGKH